MNQRQSQPLSTDLIESLSDGLAALLVAEWQARQPSRLILGEVTMESKRQSETISYEANTGVLGQHGGVLLGGNVLLQAVST